ncbi:MAG TPA: bifunctional 4-hydroxy-2-oxoglutarate aldolase/2-dehydro-3-deoxy-phosphogluconate aldolase [Tepidisphaeraceae bacterium]|nr:bifunctional 4-hydroxy-2-oxoglutarate aldolase/2-dehydro-3-deoxy-phosphogluconate aldolase [Tepidisphaeraceae bacterium]
MAERVAQRITDAGLVAIVRADDVGVDALVAAAGALLAGGVTVMEITLNTPGALAAIEVIRGRHPRMLCGAGTVLDARDARAAISAGAQFVITPTLARGTIETCRRYDVPVSAGCASPAEALAAVAAGAEFVKVFPATRFGLTHMREALDEMPTLRLIPTGGVTPANCGEYFAIGCAAVAVGSNLVGKQVLATEDWGAIERAARAFVGAVRATRTRTDGLGGQE